jgi:hypothetical protein
MGARVAHNGIEIERTEEGGSGNTNRAQTLWQVNMPRHAWGELSRSDSTVVLGLNVQWMTRLRLEPFLVV